MATFNRFNAWTDTMVESANCGSDQFAIALTNTAPSASNTVLADITQIAYTGFGSRNLTTTSSSQTAGDYSLVFGNLTLGTTVTSATFRYVVIYDDTLAGDPLVGWYDLGSGTTIPENTAIIFSGMGLDLTGSEVFPPSGFGWTPPVRIFNNSGVYTTDYDPTPFLVEGDPGVTTFYIDGDTGNDSNPGTSAWPKKSFYPVTNTRYTKLLLKIRGTFYREVASYIDYLHDNLCVEAWGGATAILTKETDPVSYPWVWTSEGSGTWSAPWPAGSGNIPSNAYAGTSVDTLSRLTPVASSALCLSTASSQYIDYGGGKLWVHTASGSSPATGHTIYGATGSSGVFECSAQAYPQRAQYVGIQFRGGEAAFRISGDSAYSKSIEFVNCSFKHGSTFGAFHGTGNATIIMYGCTAGPSVFDGFSYSTASGGVGGNVPSVVEINCIGRNNGWQATGANQGSTTHYTGKLVRVNGTYNNNADDQIADVGADTRSWNLGCTLGPKGIGSSKSGAQAGNDGTDIRMWFDGCVFTGLDYGWGAASGATIYYKNQSAPSTNPSSTGTITTY